MKRKIQEKVQVCDVLTYLLTYFPSLPEKQVVNFTPPYPPAPCTEQQCYDLAQCDKS